MAKKKSARSVADMLPDVRRVLRKVYEISEQEPDQKADWDTLLGQIK